MPAAGGAAASGAPPAARATLPRVRAALRTCSAAAVAYGRCARAAAAAAGGAGVERGTCEPLFRELRECFWAAARAKPRSA